MCVLLSSRGFGFSKSVVPIWTGSLVVCCQHPASLVASCQIVLSASWFLQGSLPCWFTTGIGLLSGYYPVAVGRSPKPAHCDRDLFCSDWRWFFGQLSRQCVVDPWWWFHADMKFDEGWRLLHSWYVSSVWWILSLIADLSGCAVRSVDLSVSICQLWWWKCFHLYMKSNEVQR